MLGLSVALGVAGLIVLILVLGPRVERQEQARRGRELTRIEWYLRGDFAGFKVPAYWARHQDEMLQELRMRAQQLEAGREDLACGSSLEAIWKDILRRWKPGISGIKARLADERRWYAGFRASTPPWDIRPQPRKLPQDEQPHSLRTAIPASVKREVWRRDQGRCVECGSRTRLEYDHIIPVSKGGSNTARNVQILCEVCNREKGADIR